MLKILIMPDSFKGCMTSEKAAETISKSLKNVIPDSESLIYPVADGGEGSVDVFINYCNGKVHYEEVYSPEWKKITAKYCSVDDTAIIEVAQASGLHLSYKKDVMNATTFGTGQLIKKALDGGFRKFIIALGGSATNDAGCGMAAALGARFLDASGKEFVPAGGTLSGIASIDLSSMDPRIGESVFTAMCDVDNPLYGKNGAAYIFGPQKGADSEQVKALDEGLRHFEKIAGTGLDSIAGAGAAGGLGAGLIFFCSAVLRSGIDTVLDIVGFDSVIEDVDYVITGEGSFDSQSLSGKVPVGIAKRASGKNVPVIVIAGRVSADDERLIYDSGITAVFDICPGPVPLDEAIACAERNLSFTSGNIFRLIKNKNNSSEE